MIRNSKIQNTIDNIMILTKARLASLVVATAVVGFIVASEGPIDWLRLLWTTLGTGLAAFGANAFNQMIERHRDAQMERTKERPLPSGRMSLRDALIVATISSSLGIVLLSVAVNLLTGALAALIHVVYLLVYTPMKPRTPLNTLVGGICGGIPPMMGWTAVRGAIEPGAWILFFILFVWQMPHFLSLAWLYREDYERGGYRMLPVVDRSGAMTCRFVILYSIALIPLAFAATMAGIAGWIFMVGALLLAIGILFFAIRFRGDRKDSSARRVFLASLVYLPLLLALLVIDRGPVFPTAQSQAGPIPQRDTGVDSAAPADLSSELILSIGDRTVRASTDRESRSPRVTKADS